MPNTATDATILTTPEAPALPTPIECDITIVQTIGGQLFKANPETKASQVKMADGTDAQTRLQTLERAVAGQTSMRIVQTIDERDAVTGLIPGDQVWVIDATADATVDKGGAKYLYMLDNTWLKVAEIESQDIVFNWKLLQDKPQSSVADIDLAVAQRHRHENMEVIAHLSEDGTGRLLYNNKAINDGQVWCAAVDSLDKIPANLADGGLVFVRNASSSAGSEAGDVSSEAGGSGAAEAGGANPGTGA